MSVQATDQPSDRIDRALKPGLTDSGDKLDVSLLSDIGLSEARRLAELWPELPKPLRQDTVRRMIIDADDEIARNYERSLAVAIEDPDQEIRIVAIEGLWESKSLTILKRLLARYAVEDSVRVRQALIRALGLFAMLANQGGLDEQSSSELKSILLTVAESDESYVVNLEALTALAYFTGEAQLHELIKRAYQSDDDGSIIAALKAMGIHGPVNWPVEILEALNHPDSEIRLEAIKAARWADDRHIRLALIDLAFDEDEDDELRSSAIESLGEFTGDETIRALQDLTQHPNVELANAATEALEIVRLDRPAGVSHLDQITSVGEQTNL